MDENKTLAEFLNEYKKQENEVHELDFKNLSEENRQLLSDFAEKKAVLKNMQNSLDFMQNSTAVLAKNENEKIVFSLESMLCIRDENGKEIHDADASKEEYVKSLIVLTKGLDPNVIEEIQKGKEPYLAEMMNSQMQTVLNEPEMKAELERQLQERKSEVTLEEVYQTQERIAEEKRRLEIQEETEMYEKQTMQQKQNEPDRTSERFTELAVAASLTVISVETAKELTKAAEKLSPDVSVSAEIADDGTAMIKNIEGVEKHAEKKINVSDVKQKVEEKIQEVKQDIKETVDHHSQEVAPKSEKAETERTTEKAEKKEVSKASKKHHDIER